MEGCFICGELFEDGSLEHVECMSAVGEFEEKTVCEECLSELAEDGELEVDEDEYAK